MSHKNARNLWLMGGKEMSEGTSQLAGRIQPVGEDSGMPYDSAGRDSDGGGTF
jgi:hypothetical protein